MAQHNKLNKQIRTIRIIAGKWRGRKINFPEVPGLRPTPDRVRETVFNWLQTDIKDARCLDLFAGSGALGLEAASRGAGHVDLVEIDSTAVNLLRKNCQSLSANNCHVIRSTAQCFMATNTPNYDVVFVDPPYRSNLWTEIANLLIKNNLLTEKAHIYLECLKKRILPDFPAQWQLSKNKVAGNVRYCLFINKQGER